MTQKNTTYNNIIYLKDIETPLGTMTACANHNGVCLLEFSDRESLPTELSQLAKVIDAKIVRKDNEHLRLLEKELNAYFDGKLKEFFVPLSPVGTAFQQQVWQSLRAIPYGKTCSYLQQAEKLGNPKAIRAVAHANGLNKIAILIPCHRVIGSNGKLTGYRGGIWRKQKLLEIEQAILF